MTAVLWTGIRFRRAIDRPQRAFGPGHQPAIDRDVVASHAAGGETLLEARADLLAREPPELVVDGFGCGNLAVDDETGQAMLDDLRYRATAISNHRRAARHRLDHHQAERLGPVDRNQQGDRAAEELRLIGVADLADIFDVGRGHHRADFFIVIIAVGPVDLGGDLERDAALFGNPDRAVDALLRCDASKECQI